MCLNVHCASSGSACVSMCTVLALDVYVLHDLAAYRYNGASRNIKAIIIAIHFQSFI